MTLTTKSASRKDRTTRLADMEHRHFATIATFIREAPLRFPEDLACYFAERLAETNPNFDRARFLRACKED